MRQFEQNLEIEYKYIAKMTKEDFHESLEDACKSQLHPRYIVSCDDYWTRGSPDQFIRYRKSGNKTELTLKFKRTQNVVRKEVNLNVEANNDYSIVEFISGLGYEMAFCIFKQAWIYEFENADVCYYQLADGMAYIEVEAVNPASLDVGIETIKEWEALLGLSEADRETRSLFEIESEKRNIGE